MLALKCERLPLFFAVLSWSLKHTSLLEAGLRGDSVMLIMTIPSRKSWGIAKIKMTMGMVRNRFTAFVE
jgi:hypothetical protein